MGLTFRTADYPSPPLGAVVGTLNDPGVRYFVQRIDPDGHVTTWKWPAGVSRYWNHRSLRRYSPKEWSVLMSRWVLVRQPAAETFRSVPIEWVESLEGDTLVWEDFIFDTTVTARHDSTNPSDLP